MFPNRLGLIAAVLLLGFIGLAVRLGSLQFGSDEADVAADLDFTREAVLPAVRGALRDRDGLLLRTARAAYDVEVFAAVFRERSAVEAWADLGVLLAPERYGDRDATVAALESRPAIVEELLELPLDVLRLPPDRLAEELATRGARLPAPHGTYLRSAARLRGRPYEAMIAVAPRGRATTQRDLRARVAAGAETIGAALAVPPADCVAGVGEETTALDRLGVELRLGAHRDVRALLRQLCDRQYDRIEAIVEDRLRDAILAQEFGVWRFTGDAARSREARELAAEIAAPYPDVDAAAVALEIAAAAEGGTFYGSGVASSAPRTGDVLLRAKEASLYDFDPARVREAAALRVIETTGFDLNSYHDARKRGQMRDDLAAFRTDVVGRDGGFALTDLVDGAGGLGGLGFKLVPSFGRDPDRAYPGGGLALLLGTVTAQGVPTSGLEELLDGVLRGEPGTARVRPDGSAEVVRAPKHGQDVKTTIVGALQDRLEKIASKSGSEMGAAAVVEVATGGVLAASSWPLPPKAAVEEALADALDAQTERVAARRALNAGDRSAASRFTAADRRLRKSAALHRAFEPPGQTPPGSVFKALTVLVGLEAGVVSESETFDCRTGVRDEGFSCERHGPVEVLEAIERSCNAFCYDIGQKVGKPLLLDAFARVGLFEAAPGIVSRAEARGMERLLREGSDDVRNLAIGQGSLSVSPVRLAGVAASLAGGRVVIPHVYRPDGFEPLRGPLGTEAHLNVIREGMRLAATTHRGTAGREHRRELEPLKIAGKTGTAQLVTSKESLNAAWFVGFAPYGPGLTPKYAFAVMLDRSARHGSAAAPIAARVVAACYDVLGGGP